MSKTILRPEQNAGLYEQAGYSPGVIANGLLFISGQVGVDETGTPVEGAEAQAVQAFENLRQVLALADCGFEDIVEITSYHVNLQAHTDALMKVKGRYIKPPFPAWTAIGVDQLWMPELLIELRVTALPKR